MSNSERQESKLIRNLGFWDLMGIAVGQIIGAGIMSSTGVAIGMTGTGVVLAYLVSPFLSIISIFPIAVLGASVPTTGGPYRYCSRILGKTPGMIYLLLHITMNVGLAQYALSFASYFVSLVTGLNQHLVAIVVLTFFFLTNLVGTKSAALLNKIMSVLLIGGLLLFIAFSVPKAHLDYVFSTSNLFNHGAFAFVSTLALLSSATSGAQVIAELGGEAKDAGRMIPRVMVLSTFLVGVFYVLIAIGAAGVLPTLNATLSWVTKPLLVACDDGVLPRSLGTVSKQGVPVKLLTLFYLVGLIPLALGFDIAFITKFTTANSLLSKLCVCAALFVLAGKSGDVLKRSSMKISPAQARVIAVIAAVVLCVLSSSLLLNLSVSVIAFLAALVVIVLIYANTYAKKIVIENDLDVDYTSSSK